MKVTVSKAVFKVTTVSALLALALTATAHAVGSGVAPQSVLQSAPQAPLSVSKNLFALGFQGGTIEVNTKTSACSITLVGQINAATLEPMRHAMQTLASAGCASRVLKLEVENGQIGSAITLGAMVRNRQFDTLIPAGRVCNTPCLLSFIAGKQRTLAAGVNGENPAQVIFTQLPRDSDFGLQSCQSQPNLAQKLTLARYINAMLPEPTSSTVLRKVLSADCKGGNGFGVDEAKSKGLVVAGG